LGDALERRRVSRYEIQLPAPAFRESRKCEEIHARVLQRAQGFRGFTDPVWHLHVEVVDLTNDVCHGVPRRGVSDVGESPERLYSPLAQRKTLFCRTLFLRGRAVRLTLRVSSSIPKESSMSKRVGPIVALFLFAAAPAAYAT